MSTLTDHQAIIRERIEREGAELVRRECAAATGLAQRLFGLSAASYVGAQEMTRRQASHERVCILVDGWELNFRRGDGKTSFFQLWTICPLCEAILSRRIDSLGELANKSVLDETRCLSCRTTVPVSWQRREAVEA